MHLIKISVRFKQIEIEISPSPDNATYIFTDNDSHTNAGLINSDVICYLNSILQVIASCIHLTEFFLSPPSKEHQRFRLYYEFAKVEFFLSPPSKEHQRFRLYYKFEKVIHSMVTGGPDVVNPYKFVDVFMSYH